MSTKEELLKYLKQYGQTHLLQFWDELNENERDQLRQNIEEINFGEVINYFKKVTESSEESSKKLDNRMKPLSKEQCGSVLETTPIQLENYKLEGLKRISLSQVGVLVMGGGQGTRLGVTYPKGMYKVGLLSNKSLFQIQAERIRKLHQIAFEKTGKNGIITWYIMTSEHTMSQTKDFLSSNKYFGLDPENIVMFEQGKLPCFSFDGEILLSQKCEISQAPDGNGGLYKVLKEKNVIADMERRGIKYLHAHSVDNILVQVADPVFIGYCISKNADCAAKVVKKVHPSEAVGVVCRVDNSYQVVEYSEITKKTSELRDENGDLVFNTGSICNHFFTTEFLRKVAYEKENLLKLHVAKKKVSYINKQGELVKPTSPNSIKIEKFVFDVFQFTENFVTWEVARQVEFSALKNSNDVGKECPKTARNDLYALHKKYLEAAGATVEGDQVEISPLLSYSGEGLEEIVKGKTIVCPQLLKSKEETL